MQLRKPTWDARANAGAGAASMGPQLCSCGNRTCRRWWRGSPGGFNGAATLQLRKHDRPHTFLAGCELLQWGRNFAVAETVRLDLPLERSLYGLQWGRNFAVAETPPPPRDLPQLESASMGPQLCSCGNRFRAARRSLGRASFNGAATLQLRKHGKLVPVDILPIRGFNGAATLQLRKL